MDYTCSCAERKSYCRICYMAEYRKQNAEKARLRTAAWREAHPLAATEAGRKRYALKKDEYVAASKARRLADPETSRAATRASAKRHPERGQACKQRRRAREAAAPGTHTGADRVAVFECYGYRCAHCAEDLLRLPRAQRHIDHVVPISRGGSNCISNLQPLCGRCNCSKGDRL